MNSKIVGKLGENFAASYISRLGYEIITRNFKARTFEIDIIAVKDQTINFVEVKTKSAFSFYEEHKAISNFKLYKIKKGIAAYLSDNPKYTEYKYEINGIVILVNPYTDLPKVVFYGCID